MEFISREGRRNPRNHWSQLASIPYDGLARKMTSAIKRTRQGARRGLTLGVMLLMFIQIAQPALAFLSRGGVSKDCGGEMTCCCSGEELAREVEFVMSCCAAQEPEIEVASHELDTTCGCKTDPVPFPAPDPVVPPEGCDGLGESALAQWVRVHGEAISVQPYGPPETACARGVPGPPSGQVSVAKIPRGASGFGVGSAGAWVLLTRGVSGLLAVLSVVRI